jgi:hypothetical protein
MLLCELTSSWSRTELDGSRPSFDLCLAKLLRRCVTNLFAGNVILPCRLGRGLVEFVIRPFKSPKMQGERW